MVLGEIVFAKHFVPSTGMGLIAGYSLLVVSQGSWEYSFRLYEPRPQGSCLKGFLRSMAVCVGQMSD